METFVSFLIAAAVTFFFVRKYLKDLNGSRKPALAGGGSVPQSLGERLRFPCPRCNRMLEEGTSFCAACGVPLSLWNVHRAPIQAPAREGESKAIPRPSIDASICIGCGSCVGACPEAGTLEVVNGKSRLAHPERCTGQAKCQAACPTSALSLALGSVLQTFKVPLVHEDFESNVPGLYIVGELGGKGLIKTAINEGKLVIDTLRRKMTASGEWTAPDPTHAAGPQGSPIQSEPPSNGVYDVLMVGAGPAGLSATLTAHQYGLQYLTLEQGEVASTIRHYPRHKFLMAEPIEMPLYGSLYIGDGTKESLLSVWENIIANTGIRVQTNERVESLQRQQELFLIQTSKNLYRAKYVVLSMGKRGTPRRLGVPGEELGKVAYQLIEAESYLDKNLLVVGGGDSAVEAAIGLAASSRNRVALSCRGKDFARIRERNQTKLKEAEAQGRLKVLRGSQVMEILDDAVLLKEDPKEPFELANDFVFVMIGGESPEEFLRKTGVEIVEKAVSF
jgi:thioredoxin reductase/NAD-dependent dihydropyrimidine dehydrogenase PreA subunit